MKIKSRDLDSGLVADEWDIQVLKEDLEQKKKWGLFKWNTELQQ
jgi:hypothetical protein